jgi:hypothetical protein
MTTATTFSPELQERLLAAAIPADEIPFGHACLLTLDREDQIESHGDRGLRGRAVAKARLFSQSGNYARVFLFTGSNVLDDTPVFYEYDRAVVAVTVELGCPACATLGPRSRHSALAERIAA